MSDSRDDLNEAGGGVRDLGSSVLRSRGGQLRSNDTSEAEYRTSEQPADSLER